MRVLFLQQQPCIRTLKYAAALRAVRPDVRLAFAYRGRTLGEWYGSGDDGFESWWRLGSDPRPDLARVLHEFRPDLIHSHNLPDDLTVAALAVADGDAPVIHDVHDLQSLRSTPYEDGFPPPDDPLTLERQALQGASAVVTVSGELLDEIVVRYGQPRQALVFPNYALRRDLPETLPPLAHVRRRTPRLVYQGTLSENGGHYDLREIFATIGSQGIRLDVYPSRPPSRSAYGALGGATGSVRLRRRLPPARLLEVLPGYDFGWAGLNASVNRAHLDTALPNKAFEYLGCGLPILTLPHRALSRFVAEEGLGVTLESLEHLPEQLAQLDVAALRRRVASVRLRFTTEAKIQDLLDLYEKVAA
jgi:glycosyltransferase involved in cell wall biosynthesis